NSDFRIRSPLINNLKPDNQRLPISVSIENKEACLRYSGISITGITIKDSPKWMQDKLKSIGLRPINNIVDITNYVLHETGQPLHAFDADEIKGNKIIVKNLPEGTKFIALDEKERKLSAEDLMICNAEEGMCIAGVFGGLKSGVKATTKNIFLESACFNPLDIRKTSFRHGLRTDAAIHFEKGMDISNTVNALKRAASLIKELANGEIASEIVDVLPRPKNKTEVLLKYRYLKKLSGKSYHPDAVKKILFSLGFEIAKEGLDDIHVIAPHHKTDIALAADVVEEIMRIDGLDNIPIPSLIAISPSVETDSAFSSYKEKIANYLIGLGFNEIFTNSITNSSYYTEEELSGTVKMINNLSAELNVMRPSLLETGLESISYNINRKINNLKFFEFGKAYGTNAIGQYVETNRLCLYITGNVTEESWRGKPKPADFFYVKGICEKIVRQIASKPISFSANQNKKFREALAGKINNRVVLEVGIASPAILKLFDIKQVVLFADFNWDTLLSMSSNDIEFHELPKQLPVHRDLAMVVDKSLAFEQVEKTVQKMKLDKLLQTQLFDVFESEKLGANKKSLAVSFTFLDDEKTLTDNEVDTMINKIMLVLEKELNAEIRKS
ncbi:MAG: phenylalanine--tRNA ligase subunit beta, partial [Bacteroidetes bacterium]|nr:phenylalanine--tRNA ligase subunit beta [Bacteroidota bacterium]